LNKAKIKRDSKQRNSEDLDFSYYKAVRETRNQGIVIMPNWRWNSKQRNNEDFSIL